MVCMSGTKPILPGPSLKFGLGGSYTNLAMRCYPRIEAPLNSMINFTIRLLHVDRNEEILSAQLLLEHNDIADDRESKVIGVFRNEKFCSPQSCRFGFVESYPMLEYFVAGAEQQHCGQYMCIIDTSIPETFNKSIRIGHNEFPFCIRLFLLTNFFLR